MILLKPPQPRFIFLLFWRILGWEKPSYQADNQEWHITNILSKFFFRNEAILSIKTATDPRVSRLRNITHSVALEVAIDGSDQDRKSGSSWDIRLSYLGEPGELPVLILMGVVS